MALLVLHRSTQDSPLRSPKQAQNQSWYQPRTPEECLGAALHWTHLAWIIRCSCQVCTRVDDSAYYIGWSTSPAGHKLQNKHTTGCFLHFELYQSISISQIQQNATPGIDCLTSSFTGKSFFWMRNKGLCTIVTPQSQHQLPFDKGATLTSQDLTQIQWFMYQNQLEPSNGILQQQKRNQLL